MDRRIIKSQKAIQDTFLNLLMEEGFDAITVKQIAEEANIGRKTFYLHYLDKYDLLDKIIDEHLARLREICDQKQEKGLVEGTVIWFRYFEQHKPLFAALFSIHSTRSFQDKLLIFMMIEVEKKLHAQNVEQQIIVKFLATAVMGVLESYILEEFNADVDSVATRVGELMKMHL
nr:TetR family transcriptional regulator [Metasolibacillus meyeri]